MKQCPVCYSGNVREFRVSGVWQLACYACGYNSLEKDTRLLKQKIRKEHDDKKKERER